MFISWNIRSLTWAIIIIIIISACAVSDFFLRSVGGGVAGGPVAKYNLCLVLKLYDKHNVPSITVTHDCV
jgi:hypothetical protein